MRKCFISFNNEMIEIFSGEYLRDLNEANLRRIVARNYMQGSLAKYATEIYSTVDRHVSLCIGMVN